MSFKADDSFGAEKNLSFEEQDNKMVNLNENAENSFLLSKLIQDSIKSNLQLIFKIIINRMLIFKLSFFNKMKKNKQSQKICKIKAEYIFTKLKNSVNVILKYYNKKEKIYQLKNFIKWRDTSIFIVKLNKFKIEFEQILQKRLEKEISMLQLRLKENEKDLSEYKNTVIKQLEMESELERKLTIYEEKENNFINQIKKFEEENKIIQKEIKTLETNNFETLENKKVFENKIKEYEEKVLQLQEENKEKDYSILLFLREMGELLQAHEKNKTENDEHKNMATTQFNSKPSMKNINLRDNSNSNAVYLSSNSSLINNNNIYSPNNINLHSSQNLSSSIRNFNSILNTMNSTNSKNLYVNSNVNSNNAFSVTNSTKQTIGYKSNLSLNNRKTNK